MFWSSFSSVCWNLSDVFIDEMINIWSHPLWVSDILLLGKSFYIELFHIKMFEFWVQNSVIGMFFSWVCSWMHAVVFVDKAMNSLINFLITDILLLGKSFYIEMLEFWVQRTVGWIRFLCSSPWLWKDALIVWSESMDSLIDTLVTNVSLVFLSKSFFWFWLV